jgi:hypothetical protein
LLAVTGGHGWWHFGKSAAGGHHQQAQQQQQKQNLPDGVQATDLRMPGVSPQQVGGHENSIYHVCMMDSFQNETYMCTSFPLDPEEEHYIGKIE